MYVWVRLEHFLGHSRHSCWESTVCRCGEGLKLQSPRPDLEYVASSSQPEKLEWVGSLIWTFPTWPPAGSSGPHATPECTWTAEVMYVTPKAAETKWSHRGMQVVRGQRVCKGEDDILWVRTAVFTLGQTRLQDLPQKSHLVRATLSGTSWTETLFHWNMVGNKS